MRTMYPVAFALMLGTAAAISLPVPSVLAAGGGGSTSTPVVRESDYDKALKAVKSEKYKDAIELLQKVVRDEPGKADAWNYLGYSQRKIGQFDPALKSYSRALELDPKHRGAREYLGELYLQTDNLPKAEELLKQLAQLCDSCSERRDLEKAVVAYKKAKGIS